MGGSGGGGGSAGEVSWPAYLESEHQTLLTNARNAASVSNPYPGATAFNGAGLISQMDGAVLNFGNAVANTNPGNPDEYNNIMSTSINRYDVVLGDKLAYRESNPNSWLVLQDIWTTTEQMLFAATKIDGEWILPTPSAADNIPLNWEDLEFTAANDTISSWTDPRLEAADNIDSNIASISTINSAVSGYAARLDDTIASDVLPRFQAGMRDINAVQSSAFAIGRAVIEGMRDRDVANFDADLTTKLTAQRDQLLSQAYLQDDKILAANTDSENKALSAVYLQADKLNAMNSDSKNKSLSQAYLDNDKLVASSINDKNKALAQVHTQEDGIFATEIANANKLRAAQLQQADKINFDSDKVANLINAEMARHGTTLIYQDTDSYFKHQESSLGIYGNWATTTVDMNRIKYVMQKEYQDKEVEYDISGTNWSMDMAMKMGNVLAAISGGTSYTPGPTGAQNALGGAFSGAAIGARATGNAYGAGAGAILGGIGAYLMGR